MLILDGKKVADHRKQLLAQKVKNLPVAGTAPKLVVVLIGSDPASEVYVRNKIKSCGEVGMRSELKKLPAEITQAEIAAVVRELVLDPDVDGILVQLPMPAHLKKREILDLIPQEKDVDGLSVASAAAFWRGDAKVWPCTPWGVTLMLEHYKISVAGKNVVVIGRSEIVGQPMAQLFLKNNATVTVAHSKTENLADVVRQAEIVVVAVGRPEFIGREHIREGAVVVDVGIHRRASDGKLVGDVRFAELEGWAQACSPVPGGVGPLTISSLLENTYELARSRRGIQK